MCISLWSTVSVKLTWETDSSNLSNFSPPGLGFLLHHAPSADEEREKRTLNSPRRPVETAIDAQMDNCERISLWRHSPSLITNHAFPETVVPFPRVFNSSDWDGDWFVATATVIELFHHTSVYKRGKNTMWSTVWTIDAYECTYASLYSSGWPSSVQYI